MSPGATSNCAGARSLAARARREVRERETMAKGEHTEDRRGGLFDDLSFSQVAAGALAAVTSMLLASQIGIYGSAIGVGVGSVVSAVASHAHKRFLPRSADKLSELKTVEPAGS